MVNPDLELDGVLKRTIEDVAGETLQLQVPVSDSTLTKSFYFFGSSSRREPTKPAPRLGPPKDKWALVVGGSVFKDPRIHSLRYAASDAVALADVLKDPQIGDFSRDHVLLLTNSKATTRAIKGGLNWLARRAGPDDLAVIYFAVSAKMALMKKE
jgi:hypothetical protein